MDKTFCIITAVAALFFIWLFIRLLKTPIKWALKLLLNALVGFIGLFVFNFLGGFIGVSLGINWVNAVITGVFGVPGVILLLLAKYIIF